MALWIDLRLDAIRIQIVISNKCVFWPWSKFKFTWTPVLLVLKYIAEKAVKNIQAYYKHTSNIININRHPIRPRAISYKSIRA